MNGNAVSTTLIHWSLNCDMMHGSRETWSFRSLLKPHKLCHCIIVKFVLDVSGKYVITQQYNQTATVICDHYKTRNTQKSALCPKSRKFARKIVSDCSFSKQSWCCTALLIQNVLCFILLYHSIIMTSLLLWSYIETVSAFFFPHRRLQMQKQNNGWNSCDWTRMPPRSIWNVQIHFKSKEKDLV